MSGFTYDAIHVKQRPTCSDAPQFSLFSAPAREILEWSDIERLRMEGSGHQRRKNDAKVKAVARFLELDARNVIPTAITVALRLDSLPNVDSSVTTITIPQPRAGEPKPGLVIDGQHRLFGVEHFDRDMPINVVALLNPSDEEIAFQFLVINNKSSKVSADHLKYLSLKFVATGLSDRLRTARMSVGHRTTLVDVVDRAEDSPFFGTIKWPTDDVPPNDPVRCVLPAAIEHALSDVIRRKIPELDDDDVLLGFFFTIWSEVKKRWPALWKIDSRLLSKVGIVSLTMFVMNDLGPLIDRGDLDIGDDAALGAQLNKALENLDPDFWRRDWEAKSLDTAAGRQIVVDALSQVRRNKRIGAEPFDDVALISPSS